MKKNCFLLLLMLTYIANSQVELDSVYIKTVDSKLSLKFFLENDSESFRYSDGESSYDIEPNVIIKTAIAVHYKFISFKAGFNPKFLANPDEETKGRTKMFNLQFSAYYKKWIQTLGYYNTKGFYGNIRDDSGNDVVFAQFPNLRNQSFRGITRYNFNKNYSFKALTSQNEIQKKSAGSFIPSLDYSYAIITDGANFEDLRSFNININVGYFYTLVLKRRLYLSGGLSPGVGIEFNKLVSTANGYRESQKDQDYVLKFDTYLGMGYNTETFFGGLYLNGLSMSRRNSSIIEFDTNRSTIQLFFGYRFKAPKPLVKTIEWLENK